MLSRLFIIFIFVPLLLFTFFKGNLLLLIFIEIVSVISTFELYKLISKKYKVNFFLVAIYSLILPILVYLYNEKYIIPSLVVLFILSSSYEVFSDKLDKATFTLSTKIFSAIYIPLSLSHIILVDKLEYSIFFLFYIFLSIWVFDSSAYICGMLLGRKIFKKNLSQYSPKKSFEGIIGATLSVLIFSYFYGTITYNMSKLFGYQTVEFRNYYNNIGLLKLFILSFAIAFLATIGDLFESKIKREFKTKDSSNLLLGHGGFLDRFDSTLFVFPIIYYILIYII